MLTAKTRLLLFLLVIGIVGAAVTVPSLQQGWNAALAKRQARQRAALEPWGDGSTRFVNVAKQAGLNYRWSIPGPRPMDILQTIGNGCAFLDYNNSGNLSILLVGTDHVALYKGDGHGHFADVSRRTHLDTLRGHFLGCAVGDYDNDGYDDIYISGYRTGILLHNEHGQYFRDVTKQEGLKPQPWGTSCAFADVSNDGRLDLFVGNYVRFDPRKDQRLCPTPAGPSVCGPLVYAPLRGVLYHNLGGGKFQDVTQKWIGRPMFGKALGDAFCNYDSSGRQSLYLANDLMPAELLQNQAGRLLNVGTDAGVAYTDGHDVSGMGVDWGDYDNDGRPDLFVGTYALEPKPLYHNIGGGLFEDVSQEVGTRQATGNALTFGVKWIDYDNSGWLSLIMANGYTSDNAYYRLSVRHVSADGHTSNHAYLYHAPFLQPILLLHNTQSQHFEDMSRQAGPDIAKPILGRGLAVGDYDNDGKEDALIVDSQGAPVLLHNESRVSGHWLSFLLVGTRSNRDGYGASVTVTAGGLTQTRWCHADGSYLSSSDKRVHVGLGSATQADTVIIHWPSGIVTTLKNIPADRQITVREGA